MKRFLFILLFPSLAFAGSATLQWTLPTDTTGIAGYQVLYGTASGVYGAPIDVAGNSTTTSFTVNGLLTGTRYYFVVRSANADKTLFSANSSEATGAIPLAAPGNLTIVITVGG